MPGSTHGYDVVDHRMIRRELGGDAGLTGLLDAAHGCDMGVIIDHVPNHCSAAEAHLNPHWWAMLRDGPGSDGAAWFDVDWPAGGDKVIVPKLGSPLDEVVAQGGLTTGEGDLGPELRYGPLRFPLAAGTEGLDVADAVGQQHYRLTWWRDPRRNVRRFFTIDDLVGIRVENDDVATVVNSIPRRLVAHPAFAGVRVDHVDGLADPERYLRRLRDLLGDDRLLLVEKILADGEGCPPSWPIDGTTGYEHIRAVDHVMLDPTAERPLTESWTQLTGDGRTFHEVDDEARREVMAGGLAPDVERVARAVAGRSRSPNSAPPTDEIAGALVELTMALDRYRTYLPGDTESKRVVAEARTTAVAARPDLLEAIADTVGAIEGDAEVRTRWQQLTGPVMAKGTEDRAFYRYLRLASLCEVGGSPERFATSVADFHAYQQRTQDAAPSAMLAGTTHDTKRSEGVRARSLALTELADEWTAFVARWFADNGELLDPLDAAITLLALQTVVTSAPIDASRLTEYLVKAAREADCHTSWTEPDGVYEDALASLATVVTALADAPSGTDAGPEASLASFIERAERPGRSNSLATLTLRLTSPGFPDIYQGSSAFLYTLVDPDNRTEPDWDERRDLAVEASRVDATTAWERPDLDVEKAVVIERVLQLRRRRPEVFGRHAGYQPIEVAGPGHSHVIAFARTDAHSGLAVDAAAGGAAVVTLVVRRPLGAPSWPGTTIGLPVGTWRNVLTDGGAVVEGGGRVDVARWLEQFPAAVLERIDVTPSRG